MRSLLLYATYLAVKYSLLLITAGVYLSFYGERESEQKMGVWTYGVHFLHIIRKDMWGYGIVIMWRFLVIT
jgi:hypothetical protein